MAWPLSFPSHPWVRLGRFGPLGLFPYTVPNDARATHMYVIGTTGQGKSKFLESLLVADIRAGRGAGLVDPHADLARDTLSNLLSSGYFARHKAYQRVIYFDPTRSDYTLPFNVLASREQPYAVAQQVIEAFRRTWPQALEEAPRFTNIALAALLVLIAAGKTLVDMAKLLTDRDFREQLLAHVVDPELISFFHDCFDKWGREGPLMIESTLNKVSAFSFNPHLRRLLGATENRLDFRAIMDRGQVLLVDLGNCDGETRRLVGSLVVTGLEMAALSRKDSRGARRPFYLFLDEFQDFCAGDGTAKTLAQILSECRKFGLQLHLAHQTLGQVQQRVAAALGNVGIKVVFSTDRHDAEVMTPELFAVDTAEVKHEAQTEVQHPLFSPLSEQWERAVAAIQELPPRTALIKRRGAAVAHIRTESIRPYRCRPEAVDRLIETLVKMHGILVREPASQPKSAPPVREYSDWEPASARQVAKGGVIFARP
jgi:hypothetical protein